MDDEKSSSEEKPVLEEYVMITDNNEIKFANAKNQYILNYNE